MQEKQIKLNGKTANYYYIANPNTNRTAHFYGGNGFALGVYEPLLTALAKQVNIVALTMRGEWIDKPTDQKLTRQQDADILIEFLQKIQADTNNMPVIGIGHSQGATATTLAAAKCPELFSQLFLLEPVTLTKSQALIYSLIPRKLLMTQEPFKSTNVKQTNWQSVDDYYQFLRTHKAFKRMSDDNLLIYAKNSLKAGDHDELTLRFAPAHELASYFGTPFILDALQQVIEAKKVPVDIILGKPSIFISEQVRQAWAKFVPAKQITVLADYGHLLPLEAPELCAQLMMEKMLNDELS